jgi:hypothetical protein
MSLLPFWNRAERISARNLQLIVTLKQRAWCTNLKLGLVCLLLSQYLPLQAARSSVGREFFPLLQNSLAHYDMFKAGNWINILEQLHAFYTLTSYFSNVINIFLIILSGLFPLGLPTKLNCEIPISHACYIHRPSFSFI